MALLLGLTAYQIHYKAVLLFNPTDKGQNQLGFYVAIGGLLSNWLANRFIRADEKKVREADRMR
jgi:Co/Zn/Cd efflux system component